MDAPASEGTTAGVGHRRWLDLLLIVATLALLVVFARHVDWASTWSAVGRADVTLLALAVAADASTLFPHDVLNAQPSEIRAAFMERKLAALGGDTTTVGKGVTSAGHTSSVASSKPRGRS